MMVEIVKISVLWPVKCVVVTNFVSVVLETEVDKTSVGVEPDGVWLVEVDVVERAVDVGVFDTVAVTVTGTVTIETETDSGGPSSSGELVDVERRSVTESMKDSMKEHPERERKGESPRWLPLRLGTEMKHQPPFEGSDLLSRDAPERRRPHRIELCVERSKRHVLQGEE